MTLHTWTSATTEQQGEIRQQIHHRLLEYRHTEQGLVNACKLDLTTVREAVASMIKTGAVVAEIGKGEKTYYAVKVR